MVWNLDLNEKYAQGVREGKLENAKENARAFLLEGIPVETISRCIGLSIEEVQKIAEEIKSETIPS